ncbi:MAG: polysaccharide biosynthesis protein, partial [Solirubrobacteraceae bacterium]|nr:polysaccharide biosynthesis protein [Solirubrobacteraceae bacterium]
MRRRIGPAAFPLHRHSLPQLLVDGVLVAVAYLLAYELRFGDLTGGVPPRFEDLRQDTMVPLIVGTLLVFVAFRMYQKWWRYSTNRDLFAVGQAVLVSAIGLAAYVAVVKPTEWKGIAVTIPSGVVVLYALLCLALVGGARVVARMFHERPIRGFRPRPDARGLLIVGAGDGGRLVLREIMRNPDLKLRPVGFVDDDPTKAGLRIDGVRVLGTTEQLARVLDEAEPDEVTIAIPSAPGVVRARVVKACRDRGIPVRTLPTVFELLQGEGRYVKQVRDVQVEDVLGREPVV